MSSTIELHELYAVVEEKMKSEKVLNSDDKKKKAEIEKIYKREQDLKIYATEGSDEAREFTKNKICFILDEMSSVNKNNIDEIIKKYHVNYFKNIYTDDDEVNLKKPVDIEIEEYFQRYSINQYDSYERKLSKLTQIVYQEIYGYSILDELVFESEFNEVACNRFDYIWIQYKGIKRKIPNGRFKFINEEYYNKIVENRMTSTSIEEMNAGEPIIFATLQNGFRITALRPPLSKFFVVNVRLFIYKDISHELRNKFMEDKMMKLVEILSSKGRRNIAIIGEQGSGKTTAADEIVIKRLDDDLAIGLAENIHELNISNNYPNKNVIELQYVRSFKPSDITEMFFRFNRDVIIYGEVRSYTEAFEMINAMLRQARGSLFTFHSSGVKRMVHDLRKLLMQTGFYTDYKEAQFDVADAVDIVIQIKLDKFTGLRYVYKVSEVVADEKDMTYEVRDLFTYDKENKKYLMCIRGLSEATLESCLEYEMKTEDISLLRELFKIKPEEKNLYEYMTESV